MSVTDVFVWMVFGLVAGLIARLLVPGRQAMGWLATMVLGVLGSFAGGFISYVFSGGEAVRSSGMLMSILGAIVVLALCLSFERRPIR